MKKNNVLRDVLIRYAYDIGFSTREIADAVSLTPSGVHNAAVRIGADRYAIKDDVSERNREMVELYKSGMTLESIGMKHGLTKERIRQILRKMAVPADVGGQAVAMLISYSERKTKRQERAEFVEKRCFANFGCSLEVLTAINGGISAYKTAGTASYSYLQQKENSEKRGIDFRLTFPEWWDVWQESGHWEQRGRGKDKYCMSRIADSGAYELGNIEIITGGQNSSYSYLITTAAERYAKRKKRTTRDSLNMTPRDAEVYKLMQSGLDASEIASRLGIKYGSAYKITRAVKARLAEASAKIIH
jgi:DNA-binding CsgD family transcriptional regulator